jgi:hypothetical protein
VRATHFLPLLLLGSCASFLPDAPEFSVETPLGTAFAHSPEGASNLVDSWLRVARSIENRLPGSKKNERLDVWLLRKEEIPDPFSIGHPMGGVTYSINGDAWLIQVPETHKLDWILAHELTHALLGRNWNTLGGVLEEGLCEWFGAQEAPELLPMRMLQVHMGAAALFGYDQAGMFFHYSARTENGDVDIRWLGEKGIAPDPVWRIKDLKFYLSQRNISTFPKVRAGLQRIGTFLIFRILEREGLQGLHQLCLDAEALGHRVIPYEMIMYAAGLNPDGSDLREELIAPLSARRLSRTLKRYGREFGHYIASEYAPHFPGYDGDHFVRLSGGTLRSEGGRNIPLFEYPALRRATQLSWPLRENTADIIDARFLYDW